MSVKFEAVRAGDLLYSVHRGRVGNTTARGTSVYKVKIVEINHASGRATVEWNSNAPRVESRRYVESLRRYPPEWSGNWINGYRCEVCRASKTSGHRPDCDHPMARRQRKAAS